MTTSTPEMLPVWTLDDAYVDIDDPFFLQSLEQSEVLLQELQSLSYPIGDEALPAALAHYEKAFDLISSLQAFCRCLSSQNIYDNRVPPVNSYLQSLLSILEQTVEPLFVHLQCLPTDSALWLQPALRPWYFRTQEKRTAWQNGLNANMTKLINQLAGRSFYPLNAQFMRLNRRLSVVASTQDGIEKQQALSQCLGVMKGAPDPSLRQSTFAGMNAFYQSHADQYADVLNQLQGFRLVQFQIAGCDALTPSFAQNRISHTAVNCMINCLRNSKAQIQDAVRLRSAYFSHPQMQTCDLMAPAPQAGELAVAESIPYSQTVKVLKQALVTVDENWPLFIDMMLEKRWLDAQISHTKTGGAFYTRFNQLKQPRVFTSYMGTLAHQIQQAHELGHAWHYWIMRDLPSIETEFPMTLAEVASTFNEAVLRRHLLMNSPDRQLHFSILWQELKSAANFMLNIPVRFEFEQQFLQQCEISSLTADQISQLMEETWREWYGDTTTDTDRYLWASKPHFYKTDQYIYNYPYTVGYLISQGLLQRQQTNPVEFRQFYRAMLRDTGRMTVDELLHTHLGVDISQPEFWQQCIDMALQPVEQFRQQFALPTCGISIEGNNHAQS